MKKLLVLFGLVIATSSCSENPDPTINSDDGATYRIDVIDGCEYIYRHGHKAGYMAHKGNCSNPYHKK